MKKNMVYIVAGIAILALGGYAMLGGGSNNKLTLDDVELGTGVTSPAIIESEDEKTNLLEEYMRTKIGNIKCTLHMEEEGGTVDQIVYISGLQMRMDATVKHEGGTSESHMINDGEYTYIWGTGGSFKMKNNNSVLEGTGDGFDMEDDTEDYGDENDLKKILEKMPENKCEKWKVDTDKFELPEGTKFQDFSDGFKMDADSIISPDQIEGLGNIENMDQLKKLIPEQLQDNKYIEQMGDKFPNTSGL